MTLIQSASLAAGLAATLATNGLAATPTHKLIDMVLESGNTGQTISTGYDTIETATVNCPDSSCTVAMDIMSNIGNSTCTTEQWAIVGLVDGISVDGGPYQNVVPNNGNTQTRDWQGTATVDRGKHTLAFQLYVPCSVNAYQWSVNYMVTRP